MPSTLADFAAAWWYHARSLLHTRSSGGVGVPGRRASLPGAANKNAGTEETIQQFLSYRRFTGIRSSPSLKVSFLLSLGIPKIPRGIPTVYPGYLPAFSPALGRFAGCTGCSSRPLLSSTGCYSFVPSAPRLAKGVVRLYPDATQYNGGWSPQKPGRLVTNLNSNESQFPSTWVPYCARADTYCSGLCHRDWQLRPSLLQLEVDVDSGPEQGSRHGERKEKEGRFSGTEKGRRKKEGGGRRE
eukprot:2203067-Rhodomonas_salina.1